MVLQDTLSTFIAATAPAHDDVQTEMAAEAEDRDFPIIGRVAGAYLQHVAAARSAEAVFEFGSGFGYSASWFLKGMSHTGDIVLTDLEEENLEQAAAYLGRSHVTEHIHFEAGDALEIIDGYVGPFDIVLLDHDKSAYDEGFETVESKMKPGGVIIADNILRGPVAYEDIHSFVVEGEGIPEDDANAAGLVRYLRTMHAHPDYHTFVLPIGNGLAVSTRME